MVTICKEWTRPAGMFLPKCIDEMFPVEGQGGCPVCVTPYRVPPPVACFGCTDPAEKFPIRWDIVSPFSITGSLPVPLNNSGTWTPGAGQYAGSTGGSAVLTTTTETYDPRGLGPLPLLVGRAAGVSGCGWGNGFTRYSVMMNKEVFGSPLNPTPTPTIFNPTPCPYSAGIAAHVIGTYGPIQGPRIYSEGSVTAVPCYDFRELFSYPEITEIPSASGAPLSPSKDGLYTVAFVGCSGNFGVTQYKRYNLRTLSPCWGWSLVPVVGTQNMRLRLVVQGYQYSVSDVPVYTLIGGCSQWVMDDWAGSSPSPGSSCFPPTPYTKSQTSGTIDWLATYPCGNPETVTLTRTGSLTGIFAGLEVPELITIRRAA